MAHDSGFFFAYIGRRVSQWKFRFQPKQYHRSQWYSRDFLLPRVRWFPLFHDPADFERMARVFSGALAHSVTQSSFAEPCTYLAAANGSSGGFDSGLQTAVQFTINITNDQERMFTDTTTV